MNVAATGLESAWAKLGRARGLASDLAGSVASYRSSAPYRVVRDADTVASEWATYAVIDRQPDPALPLVLGDCIHNLRAALDHAVYALSVASLGRELSPRESRATAYPVCDTQDDWTAAQKTMLRFLAPRPTEAIRLSQPMLAPEGARPTMPLRLISDLDNADKHRALLVTASAAGLLGVEVSDAAAGVHRFTRPRAAGGSLVSRMPLSSDPAKETTPHWKVHVRLDPSGPVRNPGILDSEIDTLTQHLVRHVEYLLGRLAATEPVERQVSDG